MGTKGIEGGKRADAWRVDPNSLVVDEGNNYSRFAVQQDRVNVIAVVKINRTLPADQQLMLLAVTIQPGNELDRELENIAENAATASLTAMDYAKQVRRLISVHQKTPAEIASIYGRTQGWVSQIKSLNRLEPDIQQALHAGLYGLTLSRGYAISKLPSHKQTEAFELLKEAWVPESEEIEDSDSGDAEGEGAATAPKRSRKASRAADGALRAAGVAGKRKPAEVRELLEAVSGFSPFANEVLDFWDGTIDTDQFQSRLTALESSLPRDENGSIVLPAAAEEDEEA